MFSQEEKIYSKEGDMPSESSQHEGEVARQGEKQREKSWFQGEAQVNIGWW